MGLTLGRLLLQARLLPVAEFGRFSAGTLVSNTFCMLACLGLYLVLQRDLPGRLVRGEALRATLLTAQCALVAAASFLVLLPAAALGGGATGLGAGGAAVSLAHGLAQQLFLVLTVESRSRGHLLRFAGQHLARGLLLLGAGAAAALATGSGTWALVAEGAVALAQVALLLRRQLGAVRARPAAVFRLAARRLARVDWRAAAALLLTAVLAFLALNLDRWVAVAWLSPEAFAHYAFAWVILSVGQSLQMLVNASVFPSLARRLTTQPPREVFAAAARVSAALLLLGLAVAAPAWALSDLALARWFPAYRGAGPIVPLFLLAASLRISNFFASVLILTGREVLLLRLSAGAIAATGLAWLAGVAAAGGGRLTLLQAALLAVLLSLTTWAGAAVAAWRTTRG